MVFNLIQAPLQFIHCPVWTPMNIGIHGMQLLIAATSGIGERNGENAAYSKFAKLNQEEGKTWPSKKGMAVIYGLGCFVSAVGTNEKAAAMMISVFYGLAAIGIMVYTPRENLDTKSFAIGASLYAAGQLGNFYHHKLLANLRKKKEGVEEKSYVIPTGGLFKYVTCPHYLCELCSWLGIAVCSGSLFSFLNVVSMVNYLSGRSCATTKWYKSKFGDDYPKIRKHLFPFLY